MSDAKATPGQVEITVEFSRHLGPRYVHGAVTLQFDAFAPYEFVSKAIWPASGNYEAAVRDTVEAVLRERMGGLTMTRVVLQRVGWDDAHSSEVGFRRAARAATEAAFNV